MIAPRELRIPVLRAALRPRRGSAMQRTSGNREVTASVRPDDGSLSITMISSGCGVSRRIEERHFLRSSGRFLVQTTTETEGWAVPTGSAFFCGVPGDTLAGGARG